MGRKPSRTASITDSITLEIGEIVNDLEKKGLAVINFGLGESDLGPPESSKVESIKAIEANDTNYTSPRGTPEIREAIVRDSEVKGLRYDSDTQVIVSVGSKQVIYLAMLVLGEPGEEFLIPKPAWVSYAPSAQLAGLKPRLVDTSEKNNFKITPQDLESVINDNTAGLILNTPNNPSGAVYTRRELEEIAKVLQEKKIPVISDEIYGKLVYDCEHVSIASLAGMQNLSIVTDGVAKTYAMGGRRVGWGLGPEKVIIEMIKADSHLASCPDKVALRASEKVFEDLDYVEHALTVYRKRRDVLLAGLDVIDGLTCQKPEGAFYAFPKISTFFGGTYQGNKIENSVDFCRLLLEKKYVAVVPGSAFGVDTHMRVAYVTSIDKIEEGCQRLAEFCEEIK